MKINRYLLLFTVFIIILSPSAMAGGVFDNIVNGFGNTSSNWANKNMGLATKIFWAISFFEFAYQAAFKKLLPGEIQKLWVWILTRCLLIYLFAKFVLDINLYSDIINWLIELGADMGGVSMSGGAGKINYSVSQLWSTLYDMWSPMVYIILGASAGAGALSTTTGMFLLYMAMAIIFVMFAMIATVTLTIVEMYLILFGGCFFTAFAGSSWTKNYWEKYLTYCVAVGVRLMFTCIILGVISSQWSDTSQWLIEIKTPSLTDPSSWANFNVWEAVKSVMTNLISMLGVMIIDMVLLITIPAKAASLLNGAVSAGLGEAIGAAAMGLSGGKALAAPTGAVAGIAKNTAKTLANPSPNAKSEAFRAMRQAGKNTIGGSKDGDLSKFRQNIRDAGKSAVQKQGFSDIASDAKNKWANASKQAGSSMANAAQKAGAGDSSHGGGSINVNPHNH